MVVFAEERADYRLWVVSGSPRKNAIFPEKPAVIPVDGFDPIDGATTRNGRCAAIAGSASAAPRCRTTLQRSPRSVVGADASGDADASADVSAASADPSARADLDRIGPAVALHPEATGDQ